MKYKTIKISYNHVLNTIKCINFFKLLSQSPINRDTLNNQLKAEENSVLQMTTSTATTTTTAMPSSATASSPSRSSQDDEEIIKVLGYEGVLLNKEEIVNFRGPIPIEQYPINNDPNPLIRHKTCNKEHYDNQEIMIRYLEPPPLPAPGEIVIKQEVCYFMFFFVLFLCSI